MEEGVQEKPKLLFRLLEGAFMAQFHVIKALSYILPPSVLCLIPKAMGIAFFYARPGMRRRLLQRITEAMPEISDPRELGRLGREVCVGVFMPLFDIFILARHGDRYMRELRLEGMDLLEEAEARGVVAAHQPLADEMASRWVVGDPQQAAARVRELAATFDVDEVMVSPVAGYVSPGRVASSLSARVLSPAASSR